MKLGPTYQRNTDMQEERLSSCPTSSRLDTVCRWQAVADAGTHHFVCLWSADTVDEGNFFIRQLRERFLFRMKATSFLTLHAPAD